MTVQRIGFIGLLVSMLFPSPLRGQADAEPWRCEVLPLPAQQVAFLIDGVEQWVIVPENSTDLMTYTTATAGDITLAIDQIVWNGFWSADNSVLLWDNRIDNLNVEVPAP